MSTAVLCVLVVVIPASAASLIVLALDVRGGRRRRPEWNPVPSRVTAVLGAGLAIGGFGLTSLAGVGHAVQASSDETVWVSTATPTGSGTLPAAPAPAGREGQPLVDLPYAPVTIWGSGFDGNGGYTVRAAVPGGPLLRLVRGHWPKVSGEGVRPLALLDPAALVAAAQAKGIEPKNGVYRLVVTSADPVAAAVFTIPATAPVPLPVAAPAPAPAPASGTGTPPATGGTAAAAAGRPPLTGAPAPPSVGVPATGSGASLLGGLVLLVCGGACAGVSLRLRRV